MRCNCLDGRIGRPDLPEGYEICWQCEGTGKRKTLYIEGFGACSEPEGKNPVSFESTNSFFVAIREFMEKHKPEFITVSFVDGTERFTMEKTL
jgi:hypothetical protein